VVSQITGINWAIKRVNLTDLKADDCRRALMEARILEQLDHPNVVKFKDVYKDR